MDIEQALHQLQQAQNDPQALTIATSQIACAALDPQLFEILEAAAIPHWFDADILAHLMQVDHETANSWLELLIKLPMVESYAARQAWNVHETTRLAIRAKLATEEKARFKQCSERCSDYFHADTAAEVTERIYHQLAGGCPGTDQNLLALYHGWRKSGRYDAHQALALVLRELLDAGLLDGVALARTLVVNGWIRESRLSVTTAEQMARTAVQLFMQVGDEYGEADAREWLGRTLQTEGYSEQALGEFNKQLDIMYRLTQRHPDNSDFQLDLSASHSNIGGVLKAQGNLAEALQTYQAEMDIMRHLTERDPNNSDWQRELSISYNNMGRVLQAQGNLAEALAAYQAQMEILRDLTERDPNNSNWQRDLSISHCDIGGVLQAQGNLAEALTAYKVLMDILRNLTERDPNNSNWKLDLSLSHNNMGRIIHAQGNLSAALIAYQTGMDILNDLTERDPNNSDWQQGLSLSHYCLATVLEEQGWLDEAMKHREADLKIAERLVTLDPSNVQWQQDDEASRDAWANLRQRIAAEK